VSSFDPPASESTPVESPAESAAPERNGPNHTAEHAAESNHVQPPAAAETTAERTHVDRAEEMVDRIAESVAGFTSRWGRRFVRALSRVREEAEDIWGEAQSIRRGDQP
jgi:hypothetical protein